MRTPPLTRRRVTAGLMAGTLVLAACGGSDETSDPAAGEALPEVDESAADAELDAGDDADAAEAATGSAILDLVGEEVQAASDFEGNQLPDVVVDDLNTGRKVNFRNLVPQDKPVLLWMWAPH